MKLDLSFLSEFQRPGYIGKLTEDPDSAPAHQWDELASILTTIQGTWRPRLQQLYETSPQLLGPITATEIYLGKVATALREVRTYQDRISANAEKNREFEVFVRWDIPESYSIPGLFCYFYETSERTRAIGRSYDYVTCRPMTIGDMSPFGVDEFVKNHVGMWFEVEEVPTYTTEMYIAAPELEIWKEQRNTSWRD